MKNLRHYSPLASQCLCMLKIARLFVDMGVYAKSPYYVGANMWNVLSFNIRNSNTKAHFKYEIKDHLKRQ